MSHWTRRAVLGLAAITAIAAVASLLSNPTGEPPVTDASQGAPAVSADRPLESSEFSSPAPDAAAREEPEDPAAMAEDANSDFVTALRWSAVDLDAVREALPDNLYWEMSTPTRDAAVLRQREEERARWNREYGKVLSGNASEEEIEAYYALRRRISEDAIEFAEYLLEHHGDGLPERDRGLLQLASRLHAARLQEMPRRMAEAHERMREQNRLREAWLADEAAFEGAPPERSN